MYFDDYEKFRESECRAYLIDIMLREYEIHCLPEGDKLKNLRIILCRTSRTDKAIVKIVPEPADNHIYFAWLKAVLSHMKEQLDSLQGVEK